MSNRRRMRRHDGTHDRSTPRPVLLLSHPLLPSSLLVDYGDDVRGKAQPKTLRAGCPPAAEGAGAHPCPGSCAKLPEVCRRGCRDEHFGPVVVLGLGEILAE